MTVEQTAEVEALELVAGELAKLMKGRDEDDDQIPAEMVARVFHVCNAQAEMIRAGISNAQMKVEP